MELTDIEAMLDARDAKKAEADKNEREKLSADITTANTRIKELEAQLKEAQDTIAKKQNKDNPTPYKVKGLFGKEK